MRIFPPPLNIGDEEGFTREKDIFDRAFIGKGLTNLITNVADPMVIAVDGQWGSGKTTFLKMWAGELRKAGFPVVYFDAFQNDYSDDAFTTIASEIISLAQEKRKANTPTAKKFLQKSIGAGKVLLRSGLKLGVKAATLGALDAGDFEDVASAVADETSDLEDKFIGELLTGQQHKKEVIQEFRDALAELPKLLSEGHGASAVSDKPLIMIIDELDRCRPLFALEVLERIKHFFAVPRVHFVLGSHLAQLRNSVMVAYGTNIDAQTYLQKFIQFTLPLVDNKPHRHERITTKYLDHLKAVLEFKPQDQDLVKNCTELVRHIAESRTLSLRTIERIMTQLAVALAYKTETALSPATLLAGLCVLKVTEPELYLKAKMGTLTFDEVRNPLAFPVKPDQQDSYMIEHSIKYWRFCTDPNLPATDRSFQEFAMALAPYNLERQRIVPYVANSILDRLVTN